MSDIVIIPPSKYLYFCTFDKGLDGKIRKEYFVWIKDSGHRFKAEAVMASYFSGVNSRGSHVRFHTHRVYSVNGIAIQLPPRSAKLFAELDNDESVDGERALGILQGDV